MRFRLIAASSAVAIAVAATLAGCGGSGTDPQTAPETTETRPAQTAPPFRGQRVGAYTTQSAPGAIAEVPDPAGSGQTVFKLTVSDEDGYPVTATVNPRAELVSPADIEAGDEFWWSAKFFLPADFPAAPPDFVTLLQGPYGHPYYGTPPFHIEASEGSLKWQRNATYGYDIPWQEPEVRNQWVEVTVHELFAAEGFVELCIDGRQVTFWGPGSYNPSSAAPTKRLEMATLDNSNDRAPNSLYLMQYRKKGMYPSLTVYEGPLSIGPTRRSIEP